jgi:hypothetical protein
MRTITLLTAALLAAACAPTADDMRSREPTMRAAFAIPSEAASACLVRAWQGVRLRIVDMPLRVDAWTFAGRSTITIGLPKADGIPWLIDIARDGERAVATAWSRPTRPVDLEPTFASVMRQAVTACQGEVTDDRLERTSRRRVARAS